MNTNGKIMIRGGVLNDMDVRLANGLHFFFFFSLPKFSLSFASL